MAVAEELCVVDGLEVDVSEGVAESERAVGDGVVVALSLGDAPSLRVAVGLELPLGMPPVESVDVELGVTGGVELAWRVRVPVPE